MARTIRKVSDISVNLFDSTEGRTLANSLGISYNNADMLFKMDYEEADTQYTDTEISFYCEMVFLENKRKYAELIKIFESDYNPLENYDLTESGTDQRTPDLETEFSAGTADTTTQKNNQSRTSTGTNSATAATTNKSTTYDVLTGNETTSSTDSSSGSNSVTESYSGSADETKITRSGKNTTTETGTETTTHSLTRHGNIGVLTSQQMAESSVSLAPKLNIFKVVEKDISARILIQVWE